MENRSWYDLGRGYYRQGKFEEALTAYDKALELYPSDSSIWRERALCLEKLMQWGESAASYNKASELDTSSCYDSYRKRMLRRGVPGLVW
jgi:tetratricopeptide (TPR) repeat protein